MRRSLIKVIIVAELVCSCVLIANADDQKPNLIFILSDDIAQGDLGVYGQELIAAGHAKLVSKAIEMMNGARTPDPAWPDPAIASTNSKRTGKK